MGQFLNKPSRFVRISSDNPAVDPNELIRKNEFDVGMSSRAPLVHTHVAADITDLSTAFASLLLLELDDSDTILWTNDGSGVQASVIVKANGGLISDSDGLSVDFGSGTNQAARGDHVHAQTHDPVTLADSLTIDAELGGGGQELSLEVRLTPNGGIVANPDGLGIQNDFGSGVNQVARGNHSHILLHNPVTVLPSASLILSVDENQELIGAVRLKSSFGPNQAQIAVDPDGIYVPTGGSSNQAAAGNHTHPDATELASGFLSPALFRQISNMGTVVQVDTNALFSRHDVLLPGDYVGGRYRFGQAMQCLYLDLTAAGPTAQCTLGLEIDGAIVETVTIPAGVAHGEVFNFKSLTNIFLGADTYARIKGLSGTEGSGTGSPENEPVRINVTLGLRPAIGSPPTIRINAGGGTVDPFSNDTDYSGGNPATTSNACDLSGVSSPAPLAVYQSARRATTVDPILYTVDGLARGLDHTVRLHFNQFSYTGIDDEVFHVRVVGATTLSTLWVDIVDLAGGANKALVIEYTVKPDSSGQIQVKFEPQPGNGGRYGASVNGLEFLPSA